VIKNANNATTAIMTTTMAVTRNVLWATGVTDPDRPLTGNKASGELTTITTETVVGIVVTAAIVGTVVIAIRIGNATQTVVLGTGDLETVRLNHPHRRRLLAEEATIVVVIVTAEIVDSVAEVICPEIAEAVEKWNHQWKDQSLSYNRVPCHFQINPSQSLSRRNPTETPARNENITPAMKLLMTKKIKSILNPARNLLQSPRQRYLEMLNPLTLPHD